MRLCNKPPNPFLGYLIFALAILVISFLTGTAQAELPAHDMPNPTLTPGGDDAETVRDVTIYDVCQRVNGVPNPKFKSTSTVRNVSGKTGRLVYNQYGLSGNHTGYCKDVLALAMGDEDEGCELDHLCSLQLGCNNGVPRTGVTVNTNVWPQPYFGRCNAHDKDALENKLHALMCNGEITMKQAQTLISTDWISAYSTYVDERGCK